MWDSGLADRIRAKGVPVVLVGGWETRGSTVYNPRGGVMHHTAGSANGTVPSLWICTYGRADLPGPLCQVLQSRDPVEDAAYVIAAGRANHAGTGGWRGLSGNSSVGGLEVEHIGSGTQPSRRIETACRIIAALIEAPGSPRDADLVCQHFEWTTRKIDFRDLSPWTPQSVRDRIAYWVGRTAQPQPTPDLPEDEAMFVMYHPADTFWMIGSMSATQITSDTYHKAKASGIPAIAPAAGDADALITAARAPMEALAAIVGMAPEGVGAAVWKHTITDRATGQDRHAWDVLADVHEDVHPA